eukprot:COSAG02_NODE_2038_length_10038_cov_3.193480_7_plen_268_part_00
MKRQHVVDTTIYGRQGPPPHGTKRQHTAAPAAKVTPVTVRGGSTVDVPEAVLLKCQTVVRMREETKDELSVHLPGMDAAVLQFAVSVLRDDDRAGAGKDLTAIEAASSDQLGGAGPAATATLAVARAANYLECTQLATVAVRNIVALGGPDAARAAFVIADESAGTEDEQAAARARNANNDLVISMLSFAAADVLTCDLETHELYGVCGLCSAMHAWGWSQVVFLRRQHCQMPPGAVSDEEMATGTLSRISIQNVRCSAAIPGTVCL